MEILLCTDGSKPSIRSADLLRKLSFPGDTQVVILGVSENRDDLQSLYTSIDQMENKLGNMYSISSKIRSGEPSKEILAEALEFSYDLVTVSGAGKHIGLLHPQLGSTTRELARRLHTHFLVTREIPEQIGTFLVCASADAPAKETMRIGGQWISRAAHQVTLLHVITKQSEPSIPDSSSSNSNHDHASQGKLPTARLFERRKQQLRDAGVMVEIVPKLRQGMIVDQVLQELSDGHYDLLVVGAHYQPGLDRWQSTLLDDITDQLLNRSSCSVLII